MYSTYSEGKSVVAERFIKTLRNKIFKHMTVVTKIFYFDVVNDIADKCNNTYHKTIKMKPKPDSYAEYSVESNKKDPKFQVANHVRISKYKNIFTKGYLPNWSEEVFLISKIKKTVPWTYVISDLNVKNIVGTFYEKELQKTNQEEYHIKVLVETLVLKLIYLIMQQN